MTMNSCKCFRILVINTITSATSKAIGLLRVQCWIRYLSADICSSNLLVSFSVILLFQDFGAFWNRIFNCVHPSYFIAVYRFNDFGVDGGPAAKALKPKFDVLSKHIATHTGFQVPHVEVIISPLLLFEYGFSSCSHLFFLNLWRRSQMKHLIFGAIVMKSLGSLLFVFGSSLGAVILVRISTIRSNTLR